MSELQERQALLDKYMAERGLKSTRQRALIVETFFQAGGHVSVEDVWSRVRKVDGRVSVATVYRTMKLLCEAGLASERHFDDGVTRFEIEHEHHDHLVCTRCGKIEDVDLDGISALAAEVAASTGYEIRSHRVDFYGICADCR